MEKNSHMGNDDNNPKVNLRIVVSMKVYVDLQTFDNVTVIDMSKFTLGIFPIHIL